MLFLLEFLLFVIVWAIWWYRNDQKRYEKYPPGPIRLPLIGNAIQIMSKSDFPATAFQRLGDTYGEVMFLKIGLGEAVIFNSRDAIHEMLLHDKTNGRFEFAFIKDRHHNKNLGVIWSHGKTWQNLRRFTLRNLREFGFGKSATMDVVVNEEVDKFHAHLKEELSQAPDSIIEVEDLFCLTIVNVLWRLVSGKTYDYKDPKMLRLLQLNGDFFRSVNMGFDPCEAFPFLREWFPNWSRRNLQIEACDALYDYGKELLEEQRKEMKEKQEFDSFIDVFASKVEENKDDPDSDFNEEQFVMTILDLLIAGSETSSNTLTFGILYMGNSTDPLVLTHEILTFRAWEPSFRGMAHMLLNPEVQKKVQQEIDREIPEGLPIDLSMKEKLPYTAATMLEIFRYSTVVPTPAPREATEDFYFQNHLIRQGTSLIFNVHGAHFSEKAFGDPLNFRPERFLNSTGTEINQKVADKLEVFGAG